MKQNNKTEKIKNVKQRLRIKLTKKQIIIFIPIALLVAILLTVICWQGLAVTEYTVISENASENMRICLISDLHSVLYGKNQKKLISEIDKANPDIILIAGDLFNEDKKSTKNAEDLLSAIGEKYTCFYVTGNHEFYKENSDEYKALVRTYAITVLEGDSIPLTVDGQKIRICGIDDFRAYLEYGELAEEKFKEDIESCYENVDDDEISIFLYHRPFHAEIIAEVGFDFIFSGHNHGGQVRIPGLVEGLFTPKEGFFPKYPGGVYNIEDTTLVVSRGLCKNIVPRVFNRPEIVVVDIKPN